VQAMNDTYLLKLNKSNRIRSNVRQIIASLSLIVVLVVFWCLKLTGITMAGEAFCGMDEHIHGDGCPTGQLICPLEETDGHVHDESCILRELICTQAETLPHVHTEECLCYELICPLAEQEGHTHGDDCHARTLICAEEEREGHTHGDACLTPALVCTETDPEHIHDPACYDHVLTCELEETEGHLHGEDCYVTEEALSCGLEETEGHAHDETCYILIEGSYSCGLEETEGHKHTEECYYIGIGFGCGLTEEEGHVHSAECLTDETELGCGLEAVSAHIHDESCYETFDVCPLEEHIHDESGHSDIYADLETEDDWEAMIAELEEETSTGEMVASIARSQLGYAESERNFEVDGNGIRRGITRYGQWYGNPYGDWSAMFASFCLHYAGAEDLPANAGPDAMRLEWEEEELYLPWDEHQPRIGDLVFLLPEEGEESFYEAELAMDESDEEAELFEEDTYSYEEEAAGAVAIITGIDEYGLTIVQGDVDGMVEERILEQGDPAILGYGLVPESSPFAMLMAAPRAGELTYVASRVDFSSALFTGDSRSFILYVEHNGGYYAISAPYGSGMVATVPAVPIQVNADGSIYTDYADVEQLLWNITRSGNLYVLQNVATGRHLHTGTEPGILYDRGWETKLDASGTGARIMHNDRNAGAIFNANTMQFEITRYKNSGSVFNFGMVERCTVWLDGTHGNLMSLRGSDLTSQSVASGSTITLPAQWKSPTKYAYTLKGWYDVNSHAYYEPGETITVTENMLLYADWVAESYDFGRMNSDVVETVSTDSFITARLFDYNSLFNTLSLNNDYSGGSSTRWTLVEDGVVDNTGEETLDFIFIDHDGTGVISHPVDQNDENGAVWDRVTSGLYNDKLADLLFNPNREVIGKEYLGTGDHLFQYGDDPSDGEHYGYYYYDSRLNAASYNQSNQRFYVYDYLERTTDSAQNSSYSDFLPFNSPYVGTNGQNVGTYTYAGDHNEYGGTTHYSYDAKYEGSGSNPNNVATNYAMGMSIEMDFYLASRPGVQDEDGTWANQSITGEDMVFEFSGDDDVWVLIDGELILDIGGIHGEEPGTIDFSTGVVTVDGVKSDYYSEKLKNISSGEHTLTMYYLERGASMSNFKLRFNLTTRYGMTLRKEDTLTAHLLNGAQFAVYTDESCDEIYAAQLWTSKASHDRGDASTNVFTVKNGSAEMWGLAAGNTYYLVEVLGPDSMQGVPAQGVIRMRLNNQGTPDYEVLPDGAGHLTVGYTVHGYKVNEELQEAYLVVTNTEATDSEPTEISVEKIWNDDENHSGDTITAYLVANGVRVQSVTLSEANDWKHTWVNLPSADRNGTPVVYTVHEATFPGYVSTVTGVDGSAGGTAGDGTLIDADGFENGKTYLLYTKYGYIGADGNHVLLQSDADIAQNDDSYLWRATVSSSGTVTLVNREGQTFYYDNYAFRASATPGTYKNLFYANGYLYWFYDHGSWQETQYPVDSDSVLSNITYNHVLYSTNSAGSALAVTPQIIGTSPTQPDSGSTDVDEPIRDFRITNTPVGDAVISLKVNKVWDLGNIGSVSEYEELGVQVELLANGKSSGLIATLNLRNGWSYTFQNLPQYDSRGHEIAYSLNEVDTHHLWHAVYGPIVAIDGSENAYETTVTNVYRATVQLPSTGSPVRTLYMLCGSSLMLFSLVYGFVSRRKRERRTK